MQGRGRKKERKKDRNESPNLFFRVYERWQELCWCCTKGLYNGFQRTSIVALGSMSCPSALLQVNKKKELLHGYFIFFTRQNRCTKLFESVQKSTNVKSSVDENTPVTTAVDLQRNKEKIRAVRRGERVSSSRACTPPRGEGGGGGLSQSIQGENVY
jgi:hypothetical protein